MNIIIVKGINKFTNEINLKKSGIFVFRVFGLGANGEGSQKGKFTLVTGELSSLNLNFRMKNYSKTFSFPEECFQKNAIETNTHVCPICKQIIRSSICNHYYSRIIKWH